MALQPHPLVILTGMSGAGKSTALRCFEDLGYYCVDNLPPTLIETFIQLYMQAQGQGSGVAVVCDVRLGELLQSFREALETLQVSGHDPHIVYLDCDDARLIDRFKETRRIPPLGGNIRVEDALAQERSKLSSMKELATNVIDTTDLSSPQLRERIHGLFGEGTDQKSVSLTLLSFGFKYGVPADADFVFDTRMLPNPYYVEDLRELNGTNPKVQDYVYSSASAPALIKGLQAITNLASREYASVHKFHAVVAVGCTGGKHRSVAITEKLAWLLTADGIQCSVLHRDIDRI